MKKFKCQDISTDYIAVEDSNNRTMLRIEISDTVDDFTQSVSLSKTDAIEFCREIMKQISLLE